MRFPNESGSYKTSVAELLSRRKSPLTMLRPAVASLHGRILGQRPFFKENALPGASAANPNVGEHGIGSERRSHFISHGSARVGEQNIIAPQKCRLEIS